eukprot:13740979-Heterocapsa_arctica.AAC.1
MKRGFTLRYIKLCLNLHYRCATSASGIASSMDDTFPGEGPVDFRKMHTDALMYFLAVQELSPLSLHMKILIGDEINKDALRAYDEHLHAHVLPPSDVSTIKELVGDGHEKVFVKC